MNASDGVRPASKQDFALALEWASHEGWNPGLDDLDAFYAADPSGFLMYYRDGVPVSSISVVRYGKDFGFLGFYIVRPDYRGQGIGWATWQAGMAHLERRSIGLDGVVAQQDNYKKSGFEFIGRNVRFSGKVCDAGRTQSDQSIRAAHHDDLPEIYRIDQQCFGLPRRQFIADWCLNPSAKTRKTLVKADQGQISGFGTIRQCNKDYKIGPIFCNSAKAAQAIFNALIETVLPQSEITIDVPSSNLSSMKFAEDVGLKPVFETARMVRGNAPEIDWQRVYGLTSFELG